MGDLSEESIHVRLKGDHIKQKLDFSKFILEKGIQVRDIMFTDECRVIQFPKINPKINIISFNENDKKIFIIMKLIKSFLFLDLSLK